MGLLVYDNIVNHHHLLCLIAFQQQPLLTSDAILRSSVYPSYHRQPLAQIAHNVKAPATSSLAGWLQLSCRSEYVADGVASLRHSHPH